MTCLQSWRCYNIVFLFLGPVHTGSRVPSPTHANKSQHGGSVPACEPQVTTKMWVNAIKIRSWLFYAQIFTWLELRVGSSFLLEQNATQVPSLTSKKCFHVGIHVIVGTWDLVEPALKSKEHGCIAKKRFQMGISLNIKLCLSLSCSSQRNITYICYLMTKQ
jgi:hypothetical protein